MEQGTAHQTATSKRKSVALSIALTLVFGPLGLLYSTVFGAIVMIGVAITMAYRIDTTQCASILIGQFILTMASVWLICMIWGSIAVDRHNRRIRS